MAIEFIVNGVSVGYNNNPVGSGMSLTLSEKATLKDVKVNKGGSMRISSGGTANKTTVNSGGLMTVFAGGTATSTLISGGKVEASSGAVVKDTTIKSGGWIDVFEGASVSKTQIGSGKMYMYGGTANNTTVNHGYVYIYDRAVLSDALIDWGRVYVSSGGTAVNIELTSGEMYVSNGGYARNVSGNGFVDMYVFAGGAASHVEVGNNMDVDVYGGGNVNDITVNNGGEVEIGGGGSATGIIVNGGGAMTVGGSISSATVSSGGAFSIANTGSATSLTISAGASFNGFAFKDDLSFAYYLAGTTEIYDNVRLVNSTYFDGTLHVSSGGLISGVSILGHRNGLYISAGGSAVETVVDGGSMHINANAAASDTIISSGRLYISSGGTHYGSLQINSGGSVSAAAGAVIDFYLADRTAEDGCLINDFSSISGSPKYTITVDKNQAAGSYILASNAGTFSEAITIGDDTDIYTLALIVGSGKYSYTIGADSVDFSLINEGGNLILNIVRVDNTPPDEPVFTVSNEELTNKDISITVEYSNDSVVRQYKINDGEWLSYTGDIVITENCKIYFRGQDAAGHWSAEEGAELSYEVTNIDKTAPEIAFFTFNEEPTDESVEVSIQAFDDNDCAKSRYRIDDGDWIVFQDYIIVEMAVNGTITVEVTDNAGNTATYTHEVNNIFKEDPVFEISGYDGEWTNQDVELFIENSNPHWTIQIFDENDKEFSLNEDNKFVVAENGTYTFVVTDPVDNVSRKEIYIGKIDKVAPTLEITGNIDDWTRDDITLTFDAADDNGYVKIEYSKDGISWNEVDNNRHTVDENGTYYFRATDIAGNVVEKDIVVDKIDKIAPKLEITGNPGEWTNKDVVLKLSVSDYSPTVIEYSTDEISWIEVDDNSLTVAENGTYYFRATDIAGNVGKECIVVEKIDKDEPNLEITGNPVEWTNKDITLIVDPSDSASGECVVMYKKDNSHVWLNVNEDNQVVISENGLYEFMVTDKAGNSNFEEIEITKIEKNTVPQPEIPGETEKPEANVIGWSIIGSAGNNYQLKLSVSGKAENAFHFSVTGNSVNFYSNSQKNFDWQVSSDGAEWSEVSSVSIKSVPERGIVEAVQDGNMDVFFATVQWVWGNSCIAKHRGKKDAWQGTGETVSLNGKNRIVDIFYGADTDTTVLVLTDDSNGDALFVDDIFSAMPKSLNEQNEQNEQNKQRARISQINTIYAGAGNDIVDMTSQRFDYSGGGVTVYGGLGNDTIWANSGDNKLFGDTGDDRIIGADGNDIIVGGAGNDMLHGGGGNDIFVFGSEFGNDQIEQLDGGTVKLYFSAGRDNVNYDEKSRTYTVYEELENGLVLTVGTVQLLGDYEVSCEYGINSEYAEMGAYDNFVSKNIFADNKGLNIIKGDAQDNKVVGSFGNDIIVGGAGDDIMHGRGGDDKFIFSGNFGAKYIEQFSDDKVTLCFATSEENVYFDEINNCCIVYEVDTATGLVLHSGTVYWNGNFEVDIQCGVDPELENTGVYDDFSNVNYFCCDSADNTFTGTSGNDVITGGFGNDVLSGNGGNDKFVFGGVFCSDIIEQTATGTVTLCFAADEDNVEYDEGSRTYTVFEKDDSGYLVNAGSVTVNSDCTVEVQYGVDTELDGNLAYNDWSGIAFQYGTADDDVLECYQGAVAGGAGNDTLVSYSASDIFVFGGNFGNDQVFCSYEGPEGAEGTVILLFESENIEFDEENRVFSDGINSVTVYGDCKIEYYCGKIPAFDSIGAYDDFVEDNSKLDDKVLIA